MTVTGRTYGLKVEHVNRLLAIGTTAEVIDTGVENFAIQWSCRRENLMRNPEVLSREVLPAVRERAQAKPRLAGGRPMPSSTRRTKGDRASNPPARRRRRR